MIVQPLDVLVSLCAGSEGQPFQLVYPEVSPAYSECLSETLPLPDPLLYCLFPALSVLFSLGLLCAKSGCACH